MSVKVYEGDTLHEGIRLALTTRLYVPGWYMRECFVRELAMCTTKSKLALFTKDKLPVASAYYSSLDGQIMVFCREAYRRHGYASSCLKSIYSPGMNADVGIAVSAFFWAKHNVPVTNW